MTYGQIQHEKTERQDDEPQMKNRYAGVITARAA